MPRHSRARPDHNARTTALTRRATDDFAAGRPADAAKSCRALLARRADAADIWHLLAASELALDSVASALSAVRRARELAPAADDYANTEALILERGGDTAAAAATWQALLARSPAHADAWYNLGRLLLAHGAPAVTAFEQAIVLRPHWLEAWKNLAHARFAAGDRDGATSAFASALRLAPDDGEALANLARLREEDDDIVSAATCYRQALAGTHDDATLLRAALLCPIFCDSAAQIAAERARVLDALSALDARDLRIAEPSRALGNPGFYFAYHGADDRELQTRIAALTTRAWRPPVLPPAPRSARPRIAVVSAHLKAHTIGHLYAPLLEKLPRAGFDLAVVSIGRHDDAVAARIAAAADVHVATVEDLEAARRAVHALGADCIFYPDIGMDPWTRYLAGQRLAPVQVMGWGHPVTSGQPTIDCFLSSRYIEPADGDAHYSETLTRLPAWPVIYEVPSAPGSGLTRADFGFGRDEHIYLCPQSLFKLHPDFDAMLAAILRQDPHGRVVLIDGRPAWRERLARRYARHCADVAARIGFIPPQTPAAFKDLLAAADVVLDTPHFSGGYTSFETIWAETPFVTLRGRYMRGRVTAGLCQLLDLDEAVTDDTDTYVSRAVALGAAGLTRDAFRATLAERKQRLLALDDSVLPAYAAFFDSALEHAAGLRDSLAWPAMTTMEQSA